MELDINFNQELERLINKSEELSDWFERNQNKMAYFELTHPGCFQFEREMVHHDTRVLGRMANSCLTHLELEGISDEEKIERAIKSMAYIYEQEKENITDNARELFKIENKGKVLKLSNK